MLGVCGTSLAPPGWLGLGVTAGTDDVQTLEMSLYDNAKQIGQQHVLYSVRLAWIAKI